ncbi:hypothetical protein VTK73DRAFT_389 [Phialemonium thermophilum]|uniref:BTB domain-containing protein n=1 Tax=Phialemonium thermophilum TaxID=223376 RepID=A0ABR3VVG6_9PEZI
MAAFQDPKDELLGSLKRLTVLCSLYEDKTYSDLTITNGGQEYHVHRAIVCPRSSFFRAACNGSFKVSRCKRAEPKVWMGFMPPFTQLTTSGQQEARTGVIDLPDDNPAAVEVMVHYFYHLDYPAVPAAGRQSAQLDSVQDEVDPRVKMACDAQEQQALAASYAARGRRRHTRRTVSSEDDPPTEIVAAGGSRLLPLHVRVYVLADKYGISGLQGLARQRFIIAAHAHWISPEFPRAVEEVYASTAESDRGLREVVRGVLWSHRLLLRRPNMAELLRRLPGLAYDVLRLLYLHDGRTEQDPERELLYGPPYRRLSTSGAMHDPATGFSD